MVRSVMLSAVLTMGLTTFASAAFVPNAIGNSEGLVIPVAEGCGPGLLARTRGTLSPLGGRSRLSTRIPSRTRRQTLLAELSRALVSGRGGSNPRRGCCLLGALAQWLAATASGDGGFGRLSCFSLSYALTVRALLPNLSVYQSLTLILCARRKRLMRHFVPPQTHMF